MQTERKIGLLTLARPTSLITCMWDFLQLKKKERIQEIELKKSNTEFHKKQT